jgi:tetratricopeptide (TPR) repeat protein
VDLTRRLPNARKFLAAVGITVIPVMAVCSWLQTRHWKDGETLWKKALSCTQGNAIAHHNLGAIDAAEGRFDEALDHYQTSLELRPSELVFINLGNLLARNGRATEAIDHFQAALRRLPDNPRLHSNLGNAFLLDNRVEEAIAAFKKALARDPRSAETHANLALALEQAGSPGAAVPHYQESINLDPLTRSSYLNLAWLLATCADSSVRDGRRAMRLVEQAIPLSKTDDIRLLDVLAAAHAEAGRFEEAAQTASRALRSALAQSNQGLAEDIRSRMQLYQQRRAFRDAAAPGKAIKRPEYSRE